MTKQPAPPNTAPPPGPEEVISIGVRAFKNAAHLTTDVHLPLNVPKEHEPGGAGPHVMVFDGPHGTWRALFLPPGSAWALVPAQPRKLWQPGMPGLPVQ